jgi:hypothetical protein
LYGTISTLALDLPDSIMAVTPQMASGWQKDLNELFRLGYLNVANLCQPNIIETVFGDKVRSLMISKDDNYLTATHILLLENHPECIGIFGSLVSAPVRDLVICHPIDEKQDISQDANMLAYVTQDTYKNSSGPVSPYLYWYYKQKYEIINYKKQGVTIPKRLNNFMHSL